MELWLFVITINFLNWKVVRKKSLNWDCEVRVNHLDLKKRIKLLDRNYGTKNNFFRNLHTKAVKIIIGCQSYENIKKI